MSRSPMRTHQQHPWHSATKRQIMGVWNDKAGNHNETAMDGSNSDHVQLLLEDLKAKYDQIVANLKADLVDTKLQQEEALNLGIMKLPKSIRQMSVKDFNESHQCDVLALLKAKDGVIQKRQNRSSDLGKKRDFQKTVVETPAPRSRAAKEAPMTESRTVRKGEGLL